MRGLVKHMSADGNSWEWPFRCTNCNQPFPTSGFPYRCEKCGGLYDYQDPISFDPVQSARPGRRSIERYRRSFPLPVNVDFVSLGEGDTPLLSHRISSREVFFKCEHLNPTGSFKDRGSAVLVTALIAAGIKEAVEDSSGNAGASLSAYAARAGIQVRIFVPEYASGPKQSQIDAFGAQVVRIPGPRSATAEAVQREAEGGIAYASHAYLPHGIAGMATIAFEIEEQLQGAPGTVITPVGQGTLLLGLHRGFRALQSAGVIDRIPALVGVQASACAPLWAIFSGGASGLSVASEGETVAEGVRIIQPLRGDAILQAVGESGGRMIAVDEENILKGRDALARIGLYVEPTSALVIAALEDVLETCPDPIVLILTGSGFKALEG
ncbi:MAG TPA: pyridoxal-phosphate dependent enzyme [Anaerolineales bacterium]|nr:pyridoxal-phosphate dependent enzyme [Anaerolineales bacterium]